MKTEYMDLLDWSNEHKTSTEISYAIFSIANDEHEAQKIWEQPTKNEFIRVWEIVTNFGMIPPEKFAWGATIGYDWKSYFSKVFGLES